MNPDGKQVSTPVRCDLISLLVIEIHQGDFNPGQVAARSPISAIAFGDAEVQAYWRDLAGRVVFSRKKTEPWGDAKVVLEFWDRRCPSVLDLRAARAGSPSKSHRGAEATSLIRLLIGS